MELTGTEYAVLYRLVAQAPNVLTHGLLLRRVWRPQRVGEGWLLRNVVKRLRRKLGDDAADPRYIITEPRVGYRMAAMRRSGSPRPRPPCRCWKSSAGPGSPCYGTRQDRQCRDTWVPFSLHTVAFPASGPAKARSWVAVSMGSPSLASRRFASACSVRHTISRGRGRPSPSMRR